MYASIALCPKTSSRGGRWPYVEKDGKRVRGIYDYSLTSRAGNGIVIYYALSPGIYFIHEILSWKRDRDYYIQVDDNGEIKEIEPPKEVSRN